MRIATYNIWNNDTIFEDRLKAICKVIAEIDADVVCLQEVRREESRSITDIIAKASHLSYWVFKEYPDCPDEGLAIISKFPINHTAAIWETNTNISNYCALRVCIHYNDIFIGITNVHLNWRSEKTREEQLKAVNNWLVTEKNCEKYEIMCGDFNDVPQSILYDLLKGYGWKDVVELIRGKDEKDYATFDLVNNCYLQEDTRPKDRLRFDWIMINSLNSEAQFSVRTVNVFGNAHSVSNLTPSDHYGLYADIITLYS